jgi:uncharacterized membrane protein YjjP (DUF1212 family)
MEQIPIVEPKTFGPLLLDMAIMLLRAGASGRRIRDTVTKVAVAYQYSLHIDLGPKSISITLLNSNGQSVFNGTRSTNAYGVDFKIISGINRLSETVSNNRWTLDEIRNELHRLQNIPNYPRILILLSVSIAGAAFCYTFGGRFVEMAVTFGATFCGLLVKQELHKRSINPYVVTYISALVAALFTGAFYVAGTGIRLENAFATCALFLIPGVPLINSVVDLVDGNILYGIERGVNAMMHAFAIAFGLSTALFIYISH